MLLNYEFLQKVEKAEDDLRKLLGGDDQKVVSLVNALRAKGPVKDVYVEAFLAVNNGRFAHSAAGWSENGSAVSEMDMISVYSTAVACVRGAAAVCAQIYQSGAMCQKWINTAELTKLAPTLKQWEQLTCISEVLSAAAEKLDKPDASAPAAETPPEPTEQKAGKEKSKPAAGKTAAKPESEPEPEKLDDDPVDWSDAFDDEEDELP